MRLVVVPAQAVVLLAADGGRLVVHRARRCQRVCRSRGAVRRRARARPRAALRPLRTPHSNPFVAQRIAFPPDRNLRIALLHRLFKASESTVTARGSSLRALHGTVRSRARVASGAKARTCIAGGSRARSELGRRARGAAVSRECRISGRGACGRQWPPAPVWGPPPAPPRAHTHAERPPRRPPPDTHVTLLDTYTCDASYAVCIFRIPTHW